MNAADVMTQAPTSIRASAPIREALVVLHSLDVRQLPVVDWKGALVGIVSDRELGSVSISRIFAKGPLDPAEAWLDGEVASIMDDAAPTIGPEADVGQLIRLMVEHKLGAVPVVRSDGVLVGMVTYVDVLRRFPVGASPAHDGSAMALKNDTSVRRGKLDGADSDRYPRS
jgi:CBS domain-containing protein